MAYFITSHGLIGNQPIANTGTTKNHQIGTVVQATDPVYGNGEFIYLKGVASTVVGDLVSFTETDGTTVGGATTRFAGTANKSHPLAVAMSANVSGQYGWYQIAGSAVVNTSGTVSAADNAYFAQTGMVGSTAAGGKQVLGMVASTAHAIPVSGQAVYIINRPHVQGQIT